LSSLSSNGKEFGLFLNKRGSAKLEKLNALLHIRNVDHKNMKYEFCLIRSNKDEIREDDFIQFLCDNILDYALSYAELHPKRLTKKELEQFFIENSARLTSKALSTFIKKSKNTGELGELFLFIALESRGFIRLLNKMALKTSSEMPFHGWDAVHIGVGSNDSILFCYGSSKMCRKFSTALNETIEEIENFTNDSSKEEHELNLVSSYIDCDRLGKYSKEITEVLSPYYRDKAKLGKAHSMFLGYEWQALENSKPDDSSTLDDHLCKMYNETRNEIIVKVENKISSLSDASGRDFLIWVMPFANLNGTRSKFRKKLGVPIKKVGI